MTATRVGTTNEWTFTPTSTQPVSISATKAGWTPYSVVIENVQPAPPAHIRQENFTYINNATEPTAVTIATPDITTDTLDGTYSVPVASQAGTPIWSSGPSLTRDAGDLVLDLGIIVTQDADLVSVDWDWPDLSTGLRMPEAGYEGTTVIVPVNAVDSLGREATVEVSIDVPAIPLAAGITDLGFFMGTDTAAVASKDIAIDLGAADPQKTMILAIEWGPETLENVTKSVSSVKIVKDGVEYLGTQRKSQAIYLKGRRIELWDMPCAVGGAATLRIGGASGTTFPGAAYVLAGKNVGFITTSNSNNLGNSVEMTAGAQFGSTRTTVVGDHVLFFAIADQINATGLFTPSANLTEAYDQTIRNEHQLLIAKGTATTTSTTSGATPTASGFAAFIHAIYRNNP